MNVLRLPNMCDVAASVALGFVEAREGILKLLTLQDGDVVLSVVSVEVANKGHGKFASAYVLAGN